jgi:all-trans-8'-apo-beta-carotenal 15,15'-oxygenase
MELAVAIRRAYNAIPDEVDDVELELLEGALPLELDGVLYRNGPGRLERGGQRYGHPFDGDGMVSKLVFDGPRGRVRYRNRFVRTREYLDEEQADRLCHRGFGTNLPGGLLRNFLRIRFKNAANTNVVAHGGRLLALWEGGWPHELDPHTLATRGRFHFEGALQNHRSRLDRFVNPELPFSAHPQLDEETGALFNFGTAFGVKNRLLLWQVDAQGRMAWQDEVVLDELSFIHDFLLTRDWLVFFLPRASFDVARAICGVATPVGSLRVDEEASMRVLLFPRPDGRFASTPPRWLSTDRGGFVFHHAAARDNDDGSLTTVGMWLPGFPQLDGDIADAFSPAGMPEAIAQPVRFHLDIDARQVKSERHSDVGAELPRAIGDRFFATSTPAGRPQPYFSSLLRASLDGRDQRVRDLFPCLVGEPVPVRFAHGGYVLVLAYEPREHRTELLIFEQETLATVARFALPHAQPPGLHGNWVSREDAERLGAYG